MDSRDLFSDFLAQLHSAAPGVVWPAVSGSGGAQILALTFQLQNSQFSPPEVLEARQRLQLQQLVEHAWTNVPFYRKRLAHGAYRPGQAIDKNWWRSLPILKRDEIQQAGADLHSRHIPREHGKVRRSSTSGSTGQALQMLGSDLNNLLWMSFLLREHLWHQRDTAAKLAIIRYAAPKSPIREAAGGVERENWGAPFSHLARTGPSVLFDIAKDTDLQVAWLRKHAPDYLLTYPSNLQAILDYCDEHAVRIDGLRQVRTISEIVPPGLREHCQRTLGASIADAYSSNEAGYMAVECPHCGQYHIQSENALIEVLDSHGEPCAPGESGRVVATPLHNFAMPLLRYEIGDHATVGHETGCAIRLPTLSHILGRSRNMLVMPDGSTRWPSFLEWTTLAPIRQYQIVQHSPTHLEAVLVTSRPLAADDEERLTRGLQEQFAYPFEVTYSYLDHIRGHENGKFEIFISKIE